MSDANGHTNVETILANPASLLIPYPTRTYDGGRVCAHEGCGTVLSRYNPDAYCDVHEDEQYDPRTLAMDYTEDGKRPCSKCGRLLVCNRRSFYNDPNSKDGLSAECIDCLNPERHERDLASKRRAYHRAGKKVRA